MTEVNTGSWLTALASVARLVSARSGALPAGRPAPSRWTISAAHGSPDWGIGSRAARSQAR